MTQDGELASEIRPILGLRKDSAATCGCSAAHPLGAYQGGPMGLIVAAHIRTRPGREGQMRFNVARFNPRLSMVLITAVAAIGLSGARAVLAPPGAGALPVGAKKCTPGQMKTTNGKKYVCDRNGHWVHVIDLTTGGVSVASGPTLSGGLTATTTEPLPTGPKMMDANTGGGGAVTCGWGSTPGDYMVQHNYIYRNGERVGYTTVTKICGEHGQWHTVARTGSSSGVTLASGVITVALPGSRS